MYFLILFASIIIVGCQGKLDSTDKSQSIIDGTWHSECLPLEETAYQLELVFSYGSNFRWLETHFIESDCAVESFRVTYEGAYELAVSSQDYIHQLELEVLVGKIEALSKIWVLEARSLNICGYQDWQLETPLSLGEGIVQESCPAVVGENFMSQNLIESKGETLKVAVPLKRDNGVPEWIGDAAIELRKSL